MKNLMLLMLFLVPAMSSAQGQVSRGGEGGNANELEITRDSVKFSLKLHVQYDTTGFELLDRGLHLYEHLLSIENPRAKELAEKLKTNLENLDSILGNKGEVALTSNGIKQVIIYNEHTIQIEETLWPKADDRQKNLLATHALMNEVAGNYLLTMEIASLLAARGRR